MANERKPGSVPRLYRFKLGTDYRLILRRMAPTAPRRPVPKSTSVPGSGVVWKLTSMYCRPLAFEVGKLNTPPFPLVCV